MNEEIKKAIESSLPEQTAGVLRDRLDRLEMIEKEHESLQKKLAEITDVKNDYHDIISEQTKELKSLREIVSNIKGREKAVSERERNIELEIMQVKLDSAEKINSNTHELVSKVFGIPSVVVSNDKTRNLIQNQTYDNNGMCHNEYHENGSTEIITKTEGKQ